MSAPATALDLPLSGVRVVEASAGTGKTFTIATLYLRLILEQGLRPEQIVVATFTRAASAELSMRLRKRLRLASQLLSQIDAAAPRSSDNGEVRDTRTAIAQALRKTGVDIEVLRKRARDAELAMDTAMIGTLHGFCHRVLGEFGFETGRALTDLELLDDTRALQDEVIGDFWRAGSADADTARILSGTWGSPEKLAQQATDSRWRGREIAIDTRASSSVQQVRERRNAALAMLDTIRNSIAGWDEDTLRTAGAELAACFDKRGWSARDSRFRGLHALFGWVATATTPLLIPGLVRKTLHDLDPQVMASMPSCKRKPQGPVFSAIADLASAAKVLDALDAQAAACVLREARDSLQREMPARMQARGLLDHDQAIDELVQALDDPRRGARVVAAIRARWQVALVDEFQDTDPAQWTILQKLFAHDDGALVLVGDPKQAIYGFRGGDVHAYLAARAHAAGEPLRLDRSYRAGAGMTAAINALFARADAFVEQAIDYAEVHSAEEVAQRTLLLAGEPAPALQLWRVPAGIDAKRKPKPCNKRDAEHAIEAACVTRIVELLTSAQTGDAQLRRNDGNARALQAGDIAVLVNNNRQAHSMQRALARAGVPAASCLRANVYASEEAQDLRLLLEALRDPSDAACARAALASLLIGADAQSIAASLHDTATLDALLQQTAAWANQIERQGPLALLHALIAQAAPRLLAAPGGERRVSNYLQLAELLQQQMDVCFGIDDLCNGYARQLADDRTEVDSDNARLRLETDAHAVQIATIHAAKGLEYGVVLLPYALLGRKPANRNHWPALHWYHDGDRAHVAIGEDVALDVAEEALDEIRGEEARKLYVGITRACAACVLPWGWVNLGERTAAHRLLHVAGRESPLPFDDAGCAQALHELAARAPEAIAVEALPGSAAGRLQPVRDARAPLHARDFDAHIERDWRTWSFSRLTRGESRRVSGDPQPGSGDEASPTIADTAPAVTFDAAPTLAGPRFGNAVHAALERADFAAWRGAGGIPAGQRELLTRSLRAQGLPQPGTVSIEEAVHSVAICVRGALNVALPCGIRLCDQAPESRRAEMEFHLRLAATRVDALFDLLHAHGYQRGRNGFGATRLNGLLTGIIDLVFQHDERYHLIDYKTNRLPAYDAASLQTAIDEHDYDLQYLLYTLALHRWLRQVLPGYNYDVHIGEVYYLFVRDLADGRGIHRDRPPRELIEAMDALFDARMEAAA